MKNMFKWFKRIMFILPLSLILLYVFLPIELRLVMLGFKDGDQYAFEENETTYVIDIDDKRMEGIHLDTDFSGVSLRLAFPSDESIVRINSDSHSCEYGLLNSEFTCSNGSFTATETSILREEIIYHYFMIQETFNYSLIPKTQR